MNPYRPTRTRILSRREEGKGYVTLGVKFAPQHAPGQFVQAGILGGGDSLDMGGPYGKGYPMGELQGRNLVLLGGGCGIASLRGVLHFLEGCPGKFGRVDTFFGFRSDDAMLFREEFPTWKDRFGLRISLDAAGEVPPGGTAKVNGHACEVGFVTSVLERAAPSPENSAALICGPPLMTRAAVQVLRKQGFSDNQVYVSSERLMYCAMGKCCHCMIKGKFTCLDGPVFRLDELEEL